MTTLGIQWLEYQEQMRHNVAQEDESHRTNFINEGIKRAQISVDKEKARETRIHNRETEALQQYQNMIDSNYRQGLLSNERSKILESRRHNQTVERETNRSNLASEELKGEQLMLDVSTSLIKSLTEAAKYAM